MADDNATIFVNIASYRDTECQHTVRDLFEKADHPDRVFVGICWQFVPDADDDCFRVVTRPDQVRVSEFHASESMGVCWARAHAQALWRGEDFTFQIDSHMRFKPGWDTLALDMLEACPSDRAVLTTYPIPYEPPDKLTPDKVVTILPKHFDKYGVLMFRSIAKDPKDAPKTPQQTAFIAAGMLFGPSAIIKDVPYDPSIYFQGEEITLATRLWTHGWDLFEPNGVLAYHDYTKRPGRVRHWQDKVDWNALNLRSVARVRHLLGIEASTDTDVTKDLESFGLGDARSLADYEAMSGIGFSDQTIDGKPAKVTASADPKVESGRRKKMFTAIYEQNGWGANETRSGDGATLSRTEVIRTHLPRLLRDLDIRVLVDAGCGEVNWQHHIAAPLQLYLGYDIVDAVVSGATSTYGQKPGFFFKSADIVTEMVAQADAILCRDCLTHLTNADVLATLDQFRRSGSRYLIATTFSNGSNADIKTGGWHPLDLRREPFNLGAPQSIVDEGLANSTKALGVWRLQGIP